MNDEAERGELRKLVERELDRRAPGFIENCREGQRKAMHLVDNGLRQIVKNEEDIERVEKRVEDISEKIEEKFDSLMSTMQSTNDSLFDLSSSFKEVSAVLAERYDHLIKDIDRVVKDLERTNSSQASLTARLYTLESNQVANLESRLSVLETRQGGIVGLGRILLPHVLTMIITASSLMFYLEIK